MEMMWDIKYNIYLYLDIGCSRQKAKCVQKTEKVKGGGRVSHKHRC